MIVVRPAEPGDLTRIMAFDALPGERITEILDRRMIVCEADTVVCAYLSWQPGALVGNDYVNKLVVDPAHRRGGIASTLSLHISTILRGRVFISAARGNTGALAMLAATGWSPLGRCTLLGHGFTVAAWRAEA